MFSKLRVAVKIVVLLDVVTKIYLKLLIKIRKYIA